MESQANVAKSPRELLRTHVSRRVAMFQNEYLSEGRRSIGARKLAILRRAAAKEPGAVPETWGLAFDGMPDCLVGRGQDPSAGELAVHGALTLYALHQQSQTEAMHISGKEHSLGFAVRRLTIKDSVKYDNLEPGELPRRFAAMVTAQSISETTHYARQLVKQLRSASIPLDYGLLAQQFYDLQSPHRADGVRLSWGRDYAQYRQPAEDNSESLNVNEERN